MSAASPATGLEASPRVSHLAAHGSSSSSSSVRLIPLSSSADQQNVLLPQPSAPPDQDTRPPPHNDAAQPSTLEWNLGCSAAVPTAAMANDPIATNALLPAPPSGPTNTGVRRNGLVMQVRTQTWAADSHGLFDYESRNVLLSEFKCACMRDSYHVTRVGTEVRFLPASEAIALYAAEPRAKPLAQIVWSNGFYNLLPPTQTPGGREEHLWLVVRHLRDRSVAVVPGDVLKLGRFRLKVKEVVLSAQDAKTQRRFLCCEDDDDDCETVAPEPGDTSAIEFDGLLGDPNAAAVTPPHGGAETPPRDSTPVLGHDVPKALAHRATTLGPRTCRICLCEADEDPEGMDTNPLVAPCECKGSMKWVHLKCLRTWMAGRLNIRSEGVSFFWRSLECELCKMTYPALVRIPSDDDTSFDNDPGSSDTADDGRAPEPSNNNNNNNEEAEEGSGVVVTTSSDSMASHPNGTVPDIGRCPSAKPEMSHSDKNAGAITTTARSRPQKQRPQSGTPRTVELFEIPRPDVPYAILEPRTQQLKGLHVVSLANNRVARLGRGHESDIRLADISVSRLHSVLRFQTASHTKRGASSLVGSSGFGFPSGGGCFVVEDNRSKFGTLLELRRPFRLDPNCSAISVQAGRTVVTVSIKRRWRLRIPACIRHHSSDIYVVFRQPCVPPPQPAAAVTALESEIVPQHHDAPLPSEDPTAQQTQR